MGLLNRLDTNRPIDWSTRTLPTLCGELGYSIDKESIYITFEYTGNYYKFNRHDREVQVDGKYLSIDDIQILTETDLIKVLDPLDRVVCFTPDENIYLLTGSFFEVARELSYNVDNIKLESEYENDDEVYVDYDKLINLLDIYNSRLKDLCRHLFGK